MIIIIIILTLIATIILKNLYCYLRMGSINSIIVLFCRCTSVQRTYFYLSVNIGIMLVKSKNFKGGPFKSLV